jgi:hypothetical protein
MGCSMAAVVEGSLFPFGTPYPCERNVWFIITFSVTKITVFWDGTSRSLWLHGVTLQKIIHFIVTTIVTSNLPRHVY